MDRSMYVSFLLFAFLGIFISTSFSDESASDMAGEDIFEMSLEQLMDIEVTTHSKRSENLFKTGAAIYVVTAEDIRRSGATCIPEALRMVPGVEVAQVNSSIWAVSIRGFN